MKRFLKIANNGKWYGFTQAEDAQEAMRMHEECKSLSAAFAQQFPGGYVLREATQEEMPPPLRRIVDAIEKQDWPEVLRALEHIDEEPSS